MPDEFKEKKSELVNFDDLNGAMGIQHMSRFYTKAGVSSLYSGVGFLTQTSEEEVQDLPDYVLSDCLQSDLDSNVRVCLHNLKKTKYFPGDAQFGTRFGAIPEGEREGVHGEGWKDFDTVNSNGEPLYSPEDLSEIASQGLDELGHVLWLITKDICDSGGFLSPDWYHARIGSEYFKDYPVSLNSANLIGELFKELCAKEQFEGDLSENYQRLAINEAGREKGTNKNKEKAEELRDYCVGLFVELAEEMGARLLMAPIEVRAEELKKAALLKRPNDFQRAGKPYSKEWFLRGVLEDRNMEIIAAIEAREKLKKD